MSEKILKVSTFLIIVIAIIHIVALNFYLYWHFWWLDILMHFMGGFWISAFLFWILYFSRFFKFQPKSFLSLLSLVVFLNLLISLGWEIFEWKLGITFSMEKYYWGDTFSDIFSSLAGGLIALLLFYRGIFSESFGNYE